MAKDMYIHTELKEFKCDICGKTFERYDSQSLQSYKKYCSLECEYKQTHKWRKHSYEFKKLILEFSIENENLSTRRIAKIFGISKDMVTSLIKQYGNRNPKKLIEFNRDYFKKIDTEEKAYWLGMLFADGCVRNDGSYSLDLTLKYADKKHIHKFANALNYSGRISERKIKLNDKIFKASRIILCSEELCKDLIDLGCFINKSLILKFPNKNQVPNYLLKHFMRGTVDGDGHIKCVGTCENSINHNFQLLGTYEFLESFINQLLDNKIINKKYEMIKKDKRRIGVNNYYITFAGNNARNTISYLYKNSNIYLDRKYKVFLNMEESMKLKEVVGFGERHTLFKKRKVIIK